MSSIIKSKKLDNVVYVLGAGFSAPLGIPVMSNFLEKSKDMFALAPDQYTNFANVFKTIDRMYKSTGYFNADLFNIEEILSILEMSEELGSDAERSSFVEYIIDVIQHYTPNLEFEGYAGSWQMYAFGKKTEKILSTYGYFVGSLLGLALSRNSEGDYFCTRSGEPRRTAKYSVVTLNYDLVLENCFFYLRKHFHAEERIGFSREIENDKAQFSQNTHLAKLHGSLDTKVIVPPTWNKGLHERIKPAWRLAYKVLSEANHIRIVGYSLPVADAYVKYLLKAAIIHCDHLKSIDVLCLDRDGSVESRYNEFICFPNYRFRGGSIKGYLEDNRRECIDRNNRPDSFHMNGLEATHKKHFND